MKEGKSIFAICDLETTYTCNFVEYMHRKNSIPFEIMAFTGLESLKNYAADHRIEILLISEKAMTEEITKMDIGQIVILSEGNHHPSTNDYPNVYKYQSSDTVIRETLNCYHASTPLPLATHPAGRQELIGIYSPVGRTAKTSFALTMGQILSKEKPVLYLNLEEYAGFEQLFGCTYGSTVGDLIYYIRQEHPNIALKLSGIVQCMNQLDYLPPAMSPLDIQNAKIEEWMKLLDIIRTDTSYETVIMDIGDGVNDLYTLLNRCSIVYMPTRQDVMSIAKLQQFEDLLNMWDYKSLLGKIKKVRLPYHRTEKKGRDYVDDLVWSQLGDFVRALIREGEDRGSV